MDGKVVLITGGDSGIGKETAMDLAKRGAILYLAGCEKGRAEKVRNEIVMASNNNKVYSIFLDLSSFDSIREFVKEFTQRETQLDVLINNAGMATSKYSLTKDGIETQFAVNYLGPFLLTILLSKLLIRSSPARVINVASVAHWLVNFDRNNLMSGRNYLALHAYAKSKLAVIMSSRILSRHLKKYNVSVNCLHPGTNRTTIGFNTSFGSKLFWAFCCIWANDPKLGCQTTVRLACDPDLQPVTGEYFWYGKARKMSWLLSFDLLFISPTVT